MFRSINTTSFDPPGSEFNPGPVPNLLWLKINVLVVDQTYQREIGRRGAANIKHIAETFEWSKFAPVIVAAIEGGLFEIVDGQHRTTAAALRGIESVPCQIIQADRMQQAQAFAAVNGKITHITPQQLFYARVSAHDKMSVDIQEALQSADVFVTRGRKTASKFVIGETQAIGALTRCYRKYGRDTLITALQCITRTSDGNAGYLRATIIESICAVLKERLDWREAGDALLRAMDDFNFVEEWDRLAEGKNVILSQVVSKALRERLVEHLEPRLKTSMKATYVERKPRGSTRSQALAAAA